MDTNIPGLWLYSTDCLAMKETVNWNSWFAVVFGEELLKTPPDGEVMILKEFSPPRMFAEGSQVEKHALFPIAALVQ